MASTYPATINNRITIGGVVHTRTKTIDADGLVTKGKPALAAAKIGALTTRTSSTVGTLTMAVSHGITTGQRLDIYWTEGGVKGHRRGVLVGTVAGNDVPFTVGAGDNLPSDETAITAQVPSEEEFLCTGNNVQYIGAKSTRRGIIVFADASDVEKHFIATELEGDTGGGYQWATGEGVTNPLAGDTITKVFFSNGNSSTTNAISAAVGVN